MGFLVMLREVVPGVAGTSRRSEGGLRARMCCVKRVLMSGVFGETFGRGGSATLSNQIGEVENLDNLQFNAKLNLRIWKFGMI